MKECIAIFILWVNVACMCLCEFGKINSGNRMFEIVREYFQILIGVDLVAVYNISVCITAPGYIKKFDNCLQVTQIQLLYIHFLHGSLWLF